MKRSFPKNALSFIKMLRQLYPVQAAKVLVEFSRANSQAKKLPQWRQQQLESFITTLGLLARDLERAYVEQRITTLAWVTRSLLELSIWIEYCNLSDANAKRFRDDVMRDLHGFVTAMQGTIEDHTGSRDMTLDQSIMNLATFARSKGIQRLGDDFQRVSNAAKELKREKEFKSMNKFLSKLAHPTAWAIHTVASVKADEGFRTMFLDDGVRLAINNLIGIRNFVRLHYPDIAN